MIRYCSALLICASLAGCMTVPVDVETGPRAPALAFLDPSLLQSAPDKGEIRIARDAGVSGAAVNVLIYLDGRHVVNVDANRVAVLRVPAGMRKIGIQYFNVSEPVEYHELRVEPGKHYDYRISGTAGLLMGEWRFERLN